jgi:hypothetical protein
MEISALGLLFLDCLAGGHMHPSPFIIPVFFLSLSVLALKLSFCSFALLLAMPSKSSDLNIYRRLELREF